MKLLEQVIKFFSPEQETASLPAPDDGEERWGVTFNAPLPEGLGTACLHDVRRRDAEIFLEQRRDTPERHVKFCWACPTGSDALCSHNETVLQRGWFYHEITNPRIMPMHDFICQCH
jgi:hypothetical protein